MRTKRILYLTLALALGLGLTLIALTLPGGSARAGDAFSSPAASDLAPTSQPTSLVSASTGDSALDLSTMAVADAGDTLEVFTNTWSYSTLGMVYDPSRDYVRYAHESQSSTHNPTIYDVENPPTHTLLFSVALSTQNSGWPWQLDNRTGVGYDADTDTYFLPDYNGDLSYADDNIVEVNVDGTILNAWEMDDEVGSNDSADGSEIDSIIDIAVVPGSPTRYFAAAAYDDNLVYEIALTKTGTLWTPNSWRTVATYTLPIWDPTNDNLGIDYDAENEILYHSSWDTTTLLLTDLNMNAITEFSPTFDCPGAGGYNSGVTFIEGSDPPEVWVTDFSSDQTTRCEAVGETPMSITWDKWIDDTPWDPDVTYIRETTDTLKVVDVLTAAQPLQLTDLWDPTRLELVEYETDPAVGSIVTGVHFLEWNLPPTPDVVTITKWFRVAPSTWSTALLSESLRLLDGTLEASRPITIEKRQPELYLYNDHPAQATAGSVTTYTLTYENVGGYENDVEIRSHFPITAPFLYADPYPTHVGGGTAIWEIGDVPGDGVTGTVDVFVQIMPTVEPTQTVEIGSEIRNHMNQVKDRTVVTYNVEDPPPLEWMWGKAVDDVDWTPGMTVTVETSDTIQVVDVITASNTSQLVELWDHTHLELTDVVTDAGVVSSAPGGLTWVVPGGSATPVAITKTFHVSPCTWTRTELWEELFVQDGFTFVPVDARPVFIEKRRPDLRINSDYDPAVDPGSTATFVLNYGNIGGYDSGAWISTTYPTEATFVSADSKPYRPVISDTHGRWAKWNIGPLPDGEGGTITVTVAISEGVPPGDLSPIFAYINDHADIEHDWTAILYHVRPPLWEKRIEIDDSSITWQPGISVTVEMSDTFEIVDVITGAFKTTLKAFWNPDRLELLAFTPTVGTIITQDHMLEWEVPRTADPVVTLTKRFQVQGKTWTQSSLHEELWVEDDFWRERPVLFRREPPDLHLTATYQAEVFPNERVTFTLHYSNTGGYESGAWITTTFPISAPFTYAEPMPPSGSYDPLGRWARWDLGPLESGESGVITVSAVISDAVEPYQGVNIYNYIYDQVNSIHGTVDVERDWAPVGYAIQPVEPAWERATWINGDGPFAEGESPFTVLPSDTVVIVDRVWITAGSTISFTLADEWATPLDFLSETHTAGTTIEGGDSLQWHNWGEAANTWHVVTKTFQILGGEWETGYLTQTLEVHHADPPTMAPAALEFDRGDYYIYLPLVLRAYP